MECEGRVLRRKASFTNRVDVRGGYFGAKLRLSVEWMLGAGTSVQGIDQETGGFFGHLESFSHADTKSIAKTEDGFLEGIFGERMADLHLSQAFAKDASDLEIGDACWIGEAGATVLLLVEKIDDGLDGEVELLGGFFLSERPT